MGGVLAAQERTVERLRTALEATGVEFTNGRQPGVPLGGRGGTIPADQLS
jgi:hypothetical protein